MDEPVSATIIPFPVRPRPDPVSGPVQSTERLSESLRGLSAALAEQRDALQRWRDALAELSAKMQSMGGTTGH